MIKTQEGTYIIKLNTKTKNIQREKMQTKKEYYNIAMK